MVSWSGLYDYFERPVIPDDLPYSRKAVAGISLVVAYPVLCLQNCEPSYKFPFLVNSLLIRTDIQPVCTKVLGHQFIIPTGAGQP